ncbi:hypothetical protein PM082_020236 [Marasmius tenuissimus]|nr:hypothetical protein PM082_020236 [Marasmius tenuissimus]
MDGDDMDDAAVEKDKLIEELTHAKEEAEKKNRLLKQKLKALTSSKFSRTPTDHANNSLFVDYSDTAQ